MNVILKTIACTSALMLTASCLSACSPKEDDTQQTTTTVATTTTALTTTTNHGSLAASDVIVRSGPGLDYDAIGGISYSEEVIILDRVGDWYCIQFGDTVGYISAQYVDVDDAPNASEMVEGLKTTSTLKATVTTTKAGNTTTVKGQTTTTVKGQTTTTVKGQTTTTTTTGLGEVTTTTTEYIGIPTVADGIPVIEIVDDF